MAIFSLYSELGPARTFQRLQREIEHVFTGSLGFESLGSARDGFPPVNLLEDDDVLVVRVEVPGVKAEQLTIEAEGQALRISGKREPRVPAEGTYLRRERWSGEFSRSLELAAELDPAAAQASLRNGVLKVRVPRREEARPRQIEIRTL